MLLEDKLLLECECDGFSYLPVNRTIWIVVHIRKLVIGSHALTQEVLSSAKKLAVELTVRKASIYFLV